MSLATLLLPARVRLAGQRLPPSVARRLGKADRLQAGEAGERAQLLRHFDLLPRGWPIAALTRGLDADDAALSAWVRADPAFVQPEMNGARLLACGDGLGLQQEDVDALLPALRPLFGDTGFTLDAPVPGRWYLRLPREARLPVFATPADALGMDLFDQLPGAGGEEGGPEGRRWRALLSEAQVVLHNHPHNQARQAAGKPPVNSLWFWGGGVLPDHVSAASERVHSDDTLLKALSLAAGLRGAALPPAFDVAVPEGLFDLRASRDLAALSRQWLEPAIAAVGGGRLSRLVLDFEDGTGFMLTRPQRWRFWRRPVGELGA